MSSSSLTKATKLYKKATKTTSSGSYERPASARISLLEDACQLYSSVINGSTAVDPNPNERLVISKNLGMTSLRLAQALVERQMERDCRRAIYLVNEAVRNLSNNWLSRPDQRELEWGAKVTDSMIAAFQTAFRSLGKETGQNWSKQLHQLDTVFEAICSDACLDRFRLQFYIERAHFYQRTAGKLIQTNNFILAERLLEYCRCDQELGRKFGGCFPTETESLVALSELEEIEDMIKFLRASCQSVKLRTAADELFEKSITDHEQINFELMWDILDMYKASALAASNEDIKNETIAIAKQGMLFHNVFKLETYAKMYCHKAVELGNAMMCTQEGAGCRWYRDCLTVIREYQRKKQEEEDKKKEEERAPFLEMLKDELAELKAVGGEYLKLLKHVYAKHPPKTEPDFKYDEKAVTPETVKKIIMKAIFHYHPDKQVGFERKWQVLCEEITKHLNCHYEHTKGV